MKTLMCLLLGLFLITSTAWGMPDDNRNRLRHIENRLYTIELRQESQYDLTRKRLRLEKIENCLQRIESRLRDLETYKP